MKKMTDQERRELDRLAYSIAIDFLKKEIRVLEDAGITAEQVPDLTRSEKLLEILEDMYYKNII